MKSRIQGTLLNSQRFLRDVRDALGYRVAMNRAQSDNLEDQHVQRSLEEVGFVSVHVIPRMSTLRICRMSRYTFCLSPCVRKTGPFANASFSMCFSPRHCFWEDIRMRNSRNRRNGRVRRLSHYLAAHNWNLLDHLKLLQNLKLGR